MKKVDFPQGALELLVLRILSQEPNHGFAIAQKIHVLSKEILTVEEGSLYPALHRMEKRKWITSEWGTTAKNRRAKYYSLTKSGEEVLEEQTASWRRLSSAMDYVLQG